VKVVLGNPPYSGISSNMGEWITSLIEDYKYVDGKHFGEKKHWLQDDYVKFIRFGEYFIDKNKEGILAYICNHSFLENPTFRGMRKHLLNTFDKIYILDLHGNSKKKEIVPNNIKDENVFEIQQGVSINIFCKTGKKRESDLASIFFYDLWGKRDYKYEQLNINNYKDVKYLNIKSKQPYYFFKEKNEDLRSQYENGILITKLFINQSMGITTARDFFVIDFEKEKLKDRLVDFSNSEFNDNYIREKYFGHKTQGKYLKGDTRGWQLAQSRQNIKNINISKILNLIAYRPFDNRYIAYTDLLVDWGRQEIMNNLLKKNFALNLVKIGRDIDAHNYFITNKITDKSIVSSLDNANTFPLYLYPDNDEQTNFDDTPQRKPNLNMEIVKEIEAKLGLGFVAEAGSPRGAGRRVDAASRYKSQSDSLDDRVCIETSRAESGNTQSRSLQAKLDADGGVEGKRNNKTFAPIDLLDYIYAVLHSPAYREKYKEFLKIDFPRVVFTRFFGHCLGSISFKHHRAFISQ